MKKKILTAMVAAMIFSSAAPANVFAGLGASGTDEKSSTASVTDLSVFTEGEKMTLKDVIELSKKGNDLSWGDFSKFKGVEVGSGLYILEYDLGNGYLLHVGGTSPITVDGSENLLYVRLSHSSDKKNSIDIRTDDVQGFIAKIKSNNDPTALKGTKQMTIDDVSELAKKGDALDWSDFADYKGRDVGSGIYIWEFELDNCLKLDVSGLVDRKPDHIILSRSNDKGIDIRTDDLKAYLSSSAAADTNAEEKTAEELEALKEFGTAFCEYMHSNSKQALASLEVPSGILTIAYFEEDEELVKAYIAQSGIDESDIRYEYMQQGHDLDEAVPSVSLRGDANNDGTVDMADVVLIMQALANPNKYGVSGTAENHLTAQGKLNADVDGNGLTVADAQAVQMKLLGLDKEKVQNIDSSLIANRSFRKENDPNLDDCSLSFGSNGTYFYHIGYYISSNQDQGTWTISGDTVVLTGEYGINKFRYEDNALFYIAEGSDGFSDLNVNYTPKDGEKFTLVPESSDNIGKYPEISDIVTIKTEYNPVMSDWSGIGILLEINSPDYPITLTAADGYFTKWDIKKGSGPIENVGKICDIGNGGYIFWDPDDFCYADEYEGESEILVEGFDGSKRFEIGKIYISKDERLRFTASFQKRLQAEPPLTQVQPLEFKTTDDVITTINNYDLKAYSEHKEVREAYGKMFERFKSDGFIYSVNINQDIQLKENSRIWLKPDNKSEDMGIKYSVVYNGRNYDVLLRSAHTDITAETKGISEYYSKRFCRDFDHETLINGRKYGISSSDDGSQITASTFVDKEHYVTLTGQNGVSENELKEFAGWLMYEKLSLEPSTQVTVGYDYVMKTKTTERLALKCNSFCAKGEKLSVDAAMGDIYLMNSDEWHYEYEIFVCDPLNFRNIEDERIIINGESGGYKKVYPKNEENIFDISENELDFDLYNHETAEIDFSNYEAGSTGCIEFSYLYRYEIDPKQHTGAIRCLYFYVGEKGVGLSGKSVEEAQKVYEANSNKAAVSKDMGMGFINYSGKTITFQLQEELRKIADTNKEIGVTPEFNVDYDFVYNGKTINEYREEWHTASGLYEKFGQLIKEGDSLKYGEALYTTGTPNGEKWDKNWYDLRLGFYGEEFLSKYIVNGEFLREKLEADRDAFINNKVSEKAYITFREALGVYDRYMIEATVRQLQKKNIRYDYAEKSNELVIYVTYSGFDELLLENVSRYKLPTIYSDDTMTMPIAYDL